MLDFEEGFFMKSFEKECWVRYAAGHYGYKNGVQVVKIGRFWTVLKFGYIKFRSLTLKDAKLFVGRYL